MELNERINFVKITDKKDADGYNEGTNKDILFSCYCKIDRYFSKLLFESLQFDITTSLNIAVRKCREINDILNDCTNVFIEYNNKFYAIKAPDFTKYQQYINILGVLHE